MIYIRNISTANINIGGIVIQPNDKYFFTDELIGSHGLDVWRILDSPSIINQLISEGSVDIIDNTNASVSNELFYEQFNKLNNSNIKRKPNFLLYGLVAGNQYNLDYSDLPQAINFKTGLTKKLFQKNTFVRGFLVEAEYFENMSISYYHDIQQYSYTNPISKVIFNWYIGDANYLDKRVSQRSWVLTTGEYSTETITHTKVYTTLTARDEGIRRRSNIINQTLLFTGGLIKLADISFVDIASVETYMRNILSILNHEINIFISGDIQPLIDRMLTLDCISVGYDKDWLNYPTPWVNVNIRQYIIAQLMGAFITNGEIIS